MTDSTLDPIGTMIRASRHHRGMTQSALARELGVNEERIGDIESGVAQLSLNEVSRIAGVLYPEQATVATERTLTTGERAKHLRIVGGTKLSGTIAVRSSKNAAVSLLCASLLNRGRTVLKGIARIEEVNRILEVLTSIGVAATWSDDNTALEIVRPNVLNLEAMDIEAAIKTRSIIMFLGPLLHESNCFEIPYAGGCDLGQRTVEPHLQALRNFGLAVVATEGAYQCKVTEDASTQRHVVLTERGDTVTENALMAAALAPGRTTIRNASPNYMVQDLCVFLQELGVGIDGIGTTTLMVEGCSELSADVEYYPSEDPIEAMSLITAAIVTGSELTIERSPIEFLEIELAKLDEMGADITATDEYLSHNGHTRLVDLTVRPAELTASTDKIHPLPFPGLNIDNLPFFAVIAASANGETMIHDWVYENRAIHLLELSKLGANVQLLDPHRLTVKGPTRWRAQEVVCPPALRPAVCLLIAMLGARGESLLRNVYVINRGYEDLANRLNALGAKITLFRD